VACKLLIFKGAKIIGIGHLDFFDRLSRYLANKNNPEYSSILTEIKIISIIFEILKIRQRKQNTTFLKWEMLCIKGTGLFFTLALSSAFLLA
jgi:hypothetical protein